MSEKITKTIGNVDKLYSQIVLNGETVASNDSVIATENVKLIPNPPKIIEVTKVPENTPSATESLVGEDVSAIELNDVLHNIKDKYVQAEFEEIKESINTEETERKNADTVLQNNIEAEETARINADTALQNNIEAEETARRNADTTLQNNIDTEAGVRQSSVQNLQSELSSISTQLVSVQDNIGDIEKLIPSSASEDNKLADKDFVNSSVATNTANFIGTFNTLEELESQTATNNDYAFWKTTDSEGNVVYKRYKYIAEDSEWIFEFDLNNSSFTAEQWATINSGLTSESLDSKQDKLESGTNIKTINGESILGEGNIEIQGGGGSLEITDSTDELTDEYSFIETGTGTVTTGRRHLLSKLWTWITKKLSARTNRVWTGSGAETYTMMSLYTDENGFTFENPLTGNDPSYSDRPFKIRKRGGEAGTMQVGQIRVDGTSDKHNYNECLRLNRYSPNDWATIALGGASGTDSGTDDNTWCLGATPSNEPNNPNELIVNRNGSSGGYSASFYKDKNSFTGLKVSGVLRNTVYGMAHEVTASKTMFYDYVGRYIQIRLLDAWVNNMLSFKVRVSHYANERMAEYLCYGYTYSTGQWHNCKAIEIGSTTSAPMRIWFGAGSDGVATVLLKWEDLGVDDYPQVDVYDVSSGYSAINYDPSNISVTITQSINWSRQDTTFLIPKVTDKLPIQYNLIDSVSDYYEFHYSESSDGTIVFSPNSSALNNKVNDFLTFIQNVPINDVKITFITSMITSSGTGQYFKFVNCPLKTKSGYRYISLNENVHLSLNPYSDAWLYIELFGRGSQFSGNDSRNNRILCASLFI